MDKLELEYCCKMVLDHGLATGHADTIMDLMEEVLSQVLDLRNERDNWETQYSITRQERDAARLELLQRARWHIIGEDLSKP